jgi:hypothetical protein
MEAWGLILRNAGSETSTLHLDFAHAEADRLNGENEALQDEIQRSNETGLAWETILRNAASGVQVVRTVSAESAAQQQRTAYTEPAPSSYHQEQAEPEQDEAPGWASTYVSKMSAMKDSLLDACEKTFNLGDQHRHSSAPSHPKEQFQGLGLR